MMDMLPGTTQEKQICTLIAPSVERLGYEVVRVKMMEEGGRHILQVMLDCADGSQITVEDCEKASKHISALLDVEDPISGQYDLEVSSPGIDRPLTRLKDFERFKGLEAKVETRMPIQGQKRFRGRLKGLEAGNHVMVVSNVVVLGGLHEEVEISIPFDAIAKAKLILNDELLQQQAIK